MHEVDPGTTQGPRRRTGVQWDYSHTRWIPQEGYEAYNVYKGREGGGSALLLMRGAEPPVVAERDVRPLPT